MKTGSLILENQLARFCNEVNLGIKPQTTDGSYFSRDLGHEGPAAATPELPPHVARMIVVKPRSGPSSRSRSGLAKVNLGGRDRVWKGMVLYCEPDEETKREFGERKEDPKTYRALLRVVDVRDTSCVAEIRGVPPSKKSAPIRQGYKVYSKIPIQPTSVESHRFFQ